MKKLALVAAFSGLLLSIQPASAATYNFNVLYSGGGSAALDAGSDNPIGTTLSDGDRFSWDIKAQGAAFWNVVTGGDFFPLMAFGLEEEGIRTGDFTLTLRRSGVEVFSSSEVAAVNSYVHLGTNTIVLGSGLQFDEMHLDYTLTSAIAEETLLPIGSTPTGLLPIFGAPELNQYYPGITYAIPEPEAYALALAGLAVVGALGRRRSAGGEA